MCGTVWDCVGLLGAAASTGGCAARHLRPFSICLARPSTQVNYSTKVLECVFKLHDGPIHSVAINEGFCVTASADRYLRVWPLDFSDFFLEAHVRPGGVVCGAVTNSPVAHPTLAPTRRVNNGANVVNADSLNEASHPLE